ncbi:phosphate ABC transporter, permease protein PstA [Sandarakinorhabdus cyanobacteriorum]|uniref:Phosphate transport system permease protein PstA n=1 Tax=Sandarakinorhabdus cyanobacteriorum TaxID=1981098 RepID=A0A255YB08_9SPHN|nr:phosphate ABC transporter permease PstA [Sandarakinorhabdus cyanobacteriorum]OYQ26427.1 phosphate ABC transporter, permease protein PstA [Sandarakinorhabdus cyanobacteriorum]
MSSVLPERRPTDWASPAMQSRIAARYRAERNFRRLGAAALVIAASFLAFLLFTIVRDGWSGFLRTEAKVEVTFTPATLGVDPAAVSGPDGKAVLARADYLALMNEAAKGLGPASGTLSDAAWLGLRDQLLADPALLGKRVTLWVPVRSTIDLLAKGKFDLAAPADSRGVSDREVAAWRWLEQQGRLRTGFNSAFLGNADSTEPELAGIGGAALGSLFTLFITIIIAFPLGVLSAVWLEEYAPKGRLADLIELSINNLAAVPSIIFGLLGLAFFLNIAGLPRSSPLVGGITLALMIMPVIVIAARVAIKAVPPSIRDAALGIGASPIQVVFQHVLPLALPGIMTGTIIGIARALGETAPLLLIGMRAFVTDVPQGLTAPATVLPMQVFLWSDDVQRGFVEKTSAAILVLLVILIAMNSLAIHLRNRFERRW